MRTIRYQPGFLFSIDIALYDLHIHTLLTNRPYYFITPTNNKGNNTKNCLYWTHSGDYGFIVFVLGCNTLNSNFIWSKLGRLSNYIHSRSDGRTYNSITELCAPCVFDEEFHLAGKSRDVQQQTAPNQTGQDRNGPAEQARARQDREVTGPALASCRRSKYTYCWPTVW